MGNQNSVYWRQADGCRVEERWGKGAEIKKSKLSNLFLVH